MSLIPVASKLIITQSPFTSSVVEARIQGVPCTLYGESGNSNEGLSDQLTSYKCAISLPKEEIDIAEFQKTYAEYYETAKICFDALKSAAPTIPATIRSYDDGQRKAEWTVAVDKGSVGALCYLTPENECSSYIQVSLPLPENDSLAHMTDIYEIYGDIVLPDLRAALNQSIQAALKSSGEGQK